MLPARNNDHRPRITSFGPDFPGLAETLERASVQRVEQPDQAEGVIVTYGADHEALAGAIASSPDLQWVQLPSAGIELFSEALRTRPDIAWTSAKGAYARPVAEHALALTLALLRELPERITARTWGRPAGTSLHGLRAVVVGAGGVAQETVRLLKTFDTAVTVVRRLAHPVDIADATVTLDDLEDLLPETDVLILAAALTESTREMISTRELDLLKESAVVVNVGRGPLIDTNALVDALDRGVIRGAALDVTTPEPLPDDHPLWAREACIITPHTADTMDMIVPLYLERIRKNVEAFASGRALEGLVNVDAGY